MPATAASGTGNNALLVVLGEDSTAVAPTRDALGPVPLLGLPTLPRSLSVRALESLLTTPVTWCEPERPLTLSTLTSPPLPRPGSGMMLPPTLPETLPLKTPLYTAIGDVDRALPAPDSRGCGARVLVDSGEGVANALPLAGRFDAEPVLDSGGAPFVAAERFGSKVPYCRLSGVGVTRDAVDTVAATG